MRVGIVVTDINDWTAKSFMSSFVDRDADVDFLNFSDLTSSIREHISFKQGQIEFNDFDILVVRDLGQKAVNDSAFRLEILRCLEMNGTFIINPPDAIARAANKFATSLALQHAGVPTPITVVTNDLGMAIKTLHEFGRIVIKPLFGYKGLGIFLLKRGDEEKLSEIMEKSGLAYLQEFVPQTTPRDIRAFVVKDRVVGAIYRLAPQGNWITNLARGGRAEPCPISSELQYLAGKASNAIGAIYSGVDLLETQNGLKVIEVNGTPSGKGIFEALGVDVTELIADYILESSVFNLP